MVASAGIATMASTARASCVPAVSKKGSSSSIHVPQRPRAGASAFVSGRGSGVIASGLAARRARVPSGSSAGMMTSSGRTARGRDRSKTVAAASGDEGDAAREEASADGEQQREEEEEEEFTVAGTVRRKREAAAAEAKKNAGGGFSLDEINPVEIGRRSRNAIDGFFKQITSLTTFQRQASYDEAKFDAVYDADLLSGASVMTEYETPNARFTTVLVIGAAGRVGRVLVRKLLLRGYTVKALVRSESDREKMPGVVEVFVGDVADADVLAAAITGVNKVCYCARAKTYMSGELNNVDVDGVKTAVKALQDVNNTMALRRAGSSQKSKKMLTNFVKFKSVYEDWTVDETRLMNPEDGRWQAAAEVAQRVNFGPQEESKFAHFDGYVFQRSGVAQVSAALEDLGTLDDDVKLRLHEGVLLRCKGDGKRYSVSLTERNGRTFIAPFTTTGKWQVVRIPFSQFRPEVFNRAFNEGGDADLGPPLDLNEVERIGIRFEARNQSATKAGAGWMSELDSPSSNSFAMALEYIKLLPKGEETDFVLVSCGGAGMPEGEERDKAVASKRQGERVLRNSGVGYTIVRPGNLVEEAGGNKALVFDQGNRITMSISCADVADVCVKALHDEEARNKSFDVCYEYGQSGGVELGYELVQQVRGKSNNYLTPALAVLEKNT